jgi:hypothetical protein
MATADKIEKLDDRVDDHAVELGKLATEQVRLSTWMQHHEEADKTRHTETVWYLRSNTALLALTILIVGALAGVRTYMEGVAGETRGSVHVGRVMSDSDALAGSDFPPAASP